MSSKKIKPMPLKRRFSSPAPTVDSDAYKQNRAIHARGYISAARTASSLAFDGFPDAFPENVDLKRIKYGCAGRTASAVAPRRALVSEPRIKPAPLLPTARPIQQMTRKVPSESDDEDYMLEDVSTEQEEEEEKDDESMDTEEDTASSVSEKPLPKTQGQKKLQAKELDTDMAAILRRLRYRPHRCVPVKSNRVSVHSQKTKAKEIGRLLNDALVWKALKQVGIPLSRLPPYRAPELSKLSQVRLENDEVLGPHLSGIIRGDKRSLADPNSKIEFTAPALGLTHLRKLPSASRSAKKQDKRSIVVPSGPIQTFGKGKRVMDANGKEIVSLQAVHAYALTLGAARPASMRLAREAVNRKIHSDWYPYRFDILKRMLGKGWQHLLKQARVEAEEAGLIKSKSKEDFEASSSSDDSPSSSSD